jgi:methionyl aminopeptidase
MAEKDNFEETALSKEQIRDYLKAGDIAREVKKCIFNSIKKDMLLVEIAEKIEEKILELGGGIAFPVNLGINEIAAHYTPSADDKTKATDLLKIDFGVEVNGRIADCALSLDFSEDKKYSEMIKLNEGVLENAIKELKIGSPAKIIGNKISEIVEKDGRFKIIRNLSGHSLGENEIHAGLTISNLKNENNFALKNIAIAIEPFLTTGVGEIYEGKPSEIYVLQNIRQPRDNDSRKLLNFIRENYKTRPFCKRWLIKLNFPKINFCLSNLAREGILHNFPVLVEKSKSPVSQAEHTIIFADKVYFTTNN